MTFRIPGETLKKYPRGNQENFGGRFSMKARTAS
ncbi:MAG: hypothetical protein RIT26_1567 [Pseudomonadota bacterium]|jgi:hypothetical protein